LGRIRSPFELIPKMLPVNYFGTVCSPEYSTNNRHRS
jgi:hypothetical protein